LIQTALIELLSDPIPSRARGAGLLSLMLDADATKSDYAVGNFRQAIDTAKTHILANQQQATNLKMSERLKELTLIDAGMVDFQWNISIRLENQSGEVASFLVP
jgi:hypothetical protein